MNKIILYSARFPQYKILKQKLTEKGLPFEENTDKEQSLSLNFTRIPILEVDGKLMDFTASVKWINEQEGEIIERS